MHHTLTLQLKSEYLPHIRYELLLMRRTMTLLDTQRTHFSSLGYKCLKDTVMEQKSPNHKNDLQGTPNKLMLLSLSKYHLHIEWGLMTTQDNSILQCIISKPKLQKLSMYLQRTNSAL